MRVPLRRQIARGIKAMLYARYGRTPAAGVRVLEYHYLDDTGSPLSVSPAEFRKHLEILATDGWRTLSPADYLQRLSAPSQPSGAKEVFITFDDGHESFARLAAPMLLEFGFTATLFVVTDLVGKSAGWFDRDRVRIGRLLNSFAFDRRERAAMEKWWSQFAAGKLIGVDELISLHQSRFGIECHSARHRFLTELTLPELRQDLADSRGWLKSQLEIDSRILCYPYGDWNDEVAGIACEVGFEAAMLSEFTGGTANRFALGRLPLGGNAGASAVRFGISHAADVLAEMTQKKKTNSGAKCVASPRHLAITSPVEPSRSSDGERDP